MAVSRLWVRNYRSLVHVSLPLADVTVVRGPNASGKTNLYRALLMLSRGASGQFARSLLAEGGMPSALWAGDRPNRKPVRVVVGVQIDEVSYEVAIGLPSIESASIFALDAEIKEERAWFGKSPNRHSLLLDRSGASATARDLNDETVTFAVSLDRFEPAVSQLGEPGRFPELYGLREQLRRWRFYHSFPTDAAAPARFTQAGVRTPVLADDGHDLAAALATIQEMGSGPALHTAIDNAFPGSDLSIDGDRGQFSIQLAFPGVRRPMSGIELSDGTLRFLYLAAALLTPRPPELLVLNEPETSLHPGLIAALAPLIAEAGRHSQVIVTTHSTELARGLVTACAAREIVLDRAANGSTTITN